MTTVADDRPSPRSGARAVAEQLAAAGVDAVFGVLAGPALEVFQALSELGVRVIGCRHEQQAAFMAQAWGYRRRRTGVALTGSGPAMTNVVTSMYTATENRWPLLVLSGSGPSGERATGGFQRAPQAAIAAPVCKWTATAGRARDLPELVHIGLRRASAGTPGAAYLDLPADVLADRTDAPVITTATAVQGPAPPSAAVSDLAETLATAERPLLLIGKGAAWQDAGGPLRRLVAMGIPFLPSPMGRGVVPDSSPWCAGAARTFATRDADVVALFGGRFNWIFSAYHRAREDRPSPRIFRVDTDAEEMHGGVDVRTGIVADAGATADAVADALEGRALRSASSGWADRIRTTAARNRERAEAALLREGDRLTPRTVVDVVARSIPPTAVVVADGELTLAAARVGLPASDARTRLDSGTSACMGVGVPYAIGARAADADTPVVAVTGDYAFGASALEVESAHRHGLPVTFVVVNNAGIAGHALQHALFGGPHPPVGSLLPAAYESLASMIGAVGVRVHDRAGLSTALREAKEGGTTAVINAVCAPEAGGDRDYLGTEYYFNP